MVDKDFTYKPKIIECPDLKQQQEKFQNLLNESLASNKKTNE